MRVTFLQAPRVYLLDPGKTMQLYFQYITLFKIRPYRLPISDSISCDTPQLFGNTLYKNEILILKIPIACY